MKTTLRWLALAVGLAVGCTAIDGDDLAHERTHDALESPSAALRIDEGDLAARLGALPGVQKVEAVPLATSGAEGFAFTISLPIDHQQPDVGRFALRVNLLHRDPQAPTILRSTGYHLPARPGDNELSGLLRANVVTVEHRFFGPSTPMRRGSEPLPPPEAWQYLTIAQAAADNHVVVQTLKQIYDGAWISSGASKGGQVSVYHRRFYPDDVDGTVAYVAPHSFGTDDPRYVTFLGQVADASCRAKVLALQRAVLTRRDEMLPVLRSQAAGQGLTFDEVGSIEMALEHLVQEYRFAFYQYGTPAGCASIPAPTASAEALLRTMTRSVPLTLSSDRNLRSVDGFLTYYYQAATELGQYGALEQGLEDLLRHPGTYTVERYARAARPPPFDPTAMRDVQQWLLEEGDHILFVYGGFDPWTAGAYAIPEGRDVYKFVVPDANHGASITSPAMPPALRAKALEVLASWTGAALPKPAELLGAHVENDAWLEAPAAAE